MKALCDATGLLQDDGSNLVRVPMMVKGEILIPPVKDRETVEAAFAGTESDAIFARLPDAQVLREPVIDRGSMEATGAYVYQVLPALDPAALPEHDIETLVNGLYAIPFSSVLAFLEAVREALEKNREVVERVREISRRTFEHPDAYLDAAFASLSLLLDPALARTLVDNELAAWGLPGSRFLDGWVDTRAEVFPGTSSLLAASVFPGQPGAASVPENAGAFLRAMPTRQLHITAGNAPAIPVVSALRAILTKSAAVIKSPYGATLPGALLAVAAAAAAPDHPITRNLSLVYWPGGDEAVEQTFFAPNRFDRIVVWGAPEAVASVRSRALFTRTICFNPRFGISMIGREAFDGNLGEIAIRASTDSMIWNQKACIASQVHYVEGSEAEAERYAVELARVFREAWDAKVPQFVQPAARGRLKRMRRGKHLQASWHMNRNAAGAFSSGVVVMPGAFDILDHPMCRLVVVRNVERLEDVLPFLHPAVSTAGVFPESRRLALRDAILARGVSNVLPLGQCERMFPGMPHDGMMVLGELVDWKNG